MGDFLSKKCDKAFLVPNLGILVFLQSFVIGKNMRVVISNFKGLDFKSDNSVLSLETKNTQIRHFWSQI